MGQQFILAGMLDAFRPLRTFSMELIRKQSYDWMRINLLWYTKTGIKHSLMLLVVTQLIDRVYTLSLIHR